MRRLASLEAAAQDEASRSTQAAQAAEMVVARFGGTIDSIGLDLELDRAALAAEAEAALALAETTSRAASEAANKARAADALLLEPAPRARVSMWICSEGSLPRSTRSATTSHVQRRSASTSRRPFAPAPTRVRCERPSWSGAASARCRGGRAPGARRAGDRAGDVRRGRAGPAGRRGRGGPTTAQRRARRDV